VTGRGGRQLGSPGLLLQVRWWSSRQWWTVAGTFAVLFVAIGEAGQTLPPTSGNRSTPIEWWNYFTLVTSPALMAMIAATFVVPSGGRVAAAGGTGITGLITSVVMSCPFCNPLAIPLLGAGGALTFLRGYRGLLAIVSVMILAGTLVLRLRGALSCSMHPRSRAPNPPG